MPRVALVTCRKRLDPDPDEALLLTSCLEAGIAAEYAAWDDASVDWSSFDLAVVRSTWDYYERERDFRDWIARTAVATDLWNPPGLMLRTIRKDYLADLQTLSIPTVPTRFVPRSIGTSVHSVVEETGWADFVIKPTVSASSFMTHRFSIGDLPDAERHLTGIHQDRDAMIQRFLPKVAERGEVALIHIDGELTHGVVKRPRFYGDEESVSEGIQPNDEQRSLAARVMATVEEPWLYARVDLMRSDDGWVLSELEVIEPSLYFLQCPIALARFVEAVRARAR